MAVRQSRNDKLAVSAAVLFSIRNFTKRITKRKLFRSSRRRCWSTGIGTIPCATRVVAHTMFVGISPLADVCSKRRSKPDPDLAFGPGQRARADVASAMGRQGAILPMARDDVSRALHGVRRCCAAWAQQSVVYCLSGRHN